MASDFALCSPQGAHTTVSSLSTAQTIAPAAGVSVDRVIIQAFTQAVRYRLDGTAPTATTGFRLSASESDVIPYASDTVLKVIEETASASVQYQFARTEAV